MDRRQFNGILASTLLLKLGWRDPENLPACPDGFRWMRSNVLEAFVPCPLGWHFHEIKHDVSKTVLISREDFRRSGTFEVGFAIAVIRDVPGEAAVWCEKIVEKIEALDKVIERFESSGSTFAMRGVEAVTVEVSPEIHTDEEDAFDIDPLLSSELESTVDWCRSSSDSPNDPFWNPDFNTEIRLYETHSNEYVVNSTVSDLDELLLENWYNSFGVTSVADDGRVIGAHENLAFGNFRDVYDEIELALLLPEGPATRQRINVVGNRKTKTLYMVQFLTPPQSWIDFWPLGKQMFEMFEINDEF